MLGENDGLARNADTHQHRYKEARITLEQLQQDKDAMVNNGQAGVQINSHSADPNIA